nr:hypothetical protein [uncultured Mediterranean phage uvMED]
MSATCKYWDCGWCYAPDCIGTNADAQSACVNPSFCPYFGWTDSGFQTNTKQTIHPQEDN